MPRSRALLDCLLRLRAEASFWVNPLALRNLLAYCIYNLEKAGCLYEGTVFLCSEGAVGFVFVLVRTRT